MTNAMIALVAIHGPIDGTTIKRLQKALESGRLKRQGNDGRVIESGLTDRVLDDPREPYTGLLVFSILQA